MIITSYIDDEEDLVLVYEGEVVGEIIDNGTILTDNYEISADKYEKNDFIVLKGTEIEFNTVTEYTELLKKFKKSSEQQQLIYGASLDCIRYTTFNYEDEFDSIGYTRHWGPAMHFWKFKDVTKQKIDLYWKDIE